jgi:hypothetical protein
MCEATAAGSGLCDEVAILLVYGNTQCIVSDRDRVSQGGGDDSLLCP